MQEKTVSEERAFVHGMLWNCQESGRSSGHQGQPVPLKKGEPDHPPAASGLRARSQAAALGLSHRPLIILSPSWLCQREPAQNKAQPLGDPIPGSLIPARYVNYGHQALLLQPSHRSLLSHSG